MEVTRPLIRKLDAAVISKIAAGEMILRPFSVAKELLENSIDAQAKTIDLEVGDAPDRLFVIRDDGIGMTPDELEVALEAHATSKLSDEDDLLRISSLGFRGEALPSIGRVSRMEILTAPDASGAGVRVRIEGGVHSTFEPVARSQGTTIRVAELFYNSPVRKRFLKSSASEVRWIQKLVATYAYAFPDIHLSWTLRGEKKLDLPPVDGLAGRIAQVHGADHLDKLLTIEIETPRATIRGFVGVPELARPGSQHQTLLVNGRWVTAPWLTAALRQGFGDLLPPGRSPFAVLLFDLDPARVDINVHPTKREIRFLDESELFGTVVRAVKAQAQTLVPTWDLDPDNRGGGWNRGGGGTDTVRDGLRGGGVLGGSGGYAARTPLPDGSVISDLWSGPFGSTGGPGPGTGPSAPEEGGGTIEQGSDVDSAAGADLASGSSVESGLDPMSRQAVRYWQLHRRYILTQTADSLFVIDQHAAHERILYEQILERFETEPLPTQQLLVPLVLELEADEFEIFQQCLDVLTRVGVEAEEFGGQTVVVRGVPTLWKESPESLFRGLLADLTKTSSRDLDARFERLAANFACRSAIKTGRSLSLHEMGTLVHQLFECAVPHGDPHGRPTYVQVPIDDLDRRFGRH